MTDIVERLRQPGDEVFSTREKLLIADKIERLREGLAEAKTFSKVVFDQLQDVQKELAASEASTLRLIGQCADQEEELAEMKALRTHALDRRNEERAMRQQIMARCRELDAELVMKNNVVEELREAAEHNAKELLRLAAELAALKAAQGEPVAYGIVDPDYARVYTQARIIAWSYGYACVMHGSFTRDLDLLLVPWTAEARANGEQLLKLIAGACGLHFSDGEADIYKAQVDFTEKAHGRKSCRLFFPETHDRRWVDISILPIEVLTQSAAPPAPEPDLRRLCDDVTTVVAQGLQYIENIGKTDDKTTAAEIVESLEGWVDRYRNDILFRAKVQSLVAQVMKAVEQNIAPSTNPVLTPEEISRTAVPDAIPTKVAQTAPERIWLQVSDDAEDCDEDFPTNTDGVSWCVDSVLNCEVEYVRADLAATPAVPDGYVLLPREPDEIMTGAAWRAGYQHAASCYAVMRAAHKASQKETKP